MALSTHVSQMAATFLSPAALETASSSILEASWMRMFVASDTHDVAGGTDDGEYDVFWFLVLIHQELVCA